MIGFVNKIKEKIRRNREMKRANSSSRMHYYLYKTRSTKQSSRAYWSVL